MPERCFSIGGLYLPVCARCTGIYFGFFTGWVLWRFVKSDKRISPVSNLLLLVFLLPLGIDGLLNTAHIINTPSLIRFFVGIMGGSIIARAMWPAIVEAGIMVEKYFHANNLSVKTVLK